MEKRFADKARSMIKKSRPADITKYDSLMDQVSNGYDPTTSERLFLDGIRDEMLKLGSELAWRTV